MAFTCCCCFVLRRRVFAAALKEMNLVETILQAPDNCNSTATTWETGKKLFEFVPNITLNCMHAPEKAHMYILLLISIHVMHIDYLITYPDKDICGYIEIR